MNRPRQSPWLPALAALAALGLALPVAGCREELGPERWATASIQGQIVAGSGPVRGGWLEILPVDGTAGDVRVVPLGPDGSFRADRVPVGRVAFRFERLDFGSNPAARRVDAVLLRSYGTPVRRTIAARPDGPIRVDLAEETLRSQSRRRPGRKRRRARNGKDGGTGGGAAAPPGCGPSDVPTIRVLYRDPAGEIHPDWPADRLAEVVAGGDGTAWVDIESHHQDCNARVESLLRDVFKFHPLAIEDAIRDTHVPRVDDWGEYLYLVAGTIDFDPEDDSLRLHELDIFLGRNFLVTYHNEPAPVLDRQRDLIGREPATKLRRGPAHLLYALLDAIGDDFLAAIEHLDTAIDDLQDEVFDKPHPSTLEQIQRIKRHTLRLERVLLPFREAINRLARDHYAAIPEPERVYFRDVYDHLVRVHDIAANLRDLVTGAIDTYLSVVSNRTNEVMKALTLVTVMFLPMTFLVGFFGMNFFGQTLEFTGPPLPKAGLFWGTVAIMLATPIAIAAFARRRGWL